MGVVRVERQAVDLRCVCLTGNHHTCAQRNATPAAQPTACWPHMLGTTAAARVGRNQSCRGAI
jgi:hypothetical protein